MNRFRKWLVWTSSVATGATGIGYAWMKYLMESPDPWAVINHPLEPWLLKGHILAAPVMLFAFGLIAGEHVWRHFRCRVPAGRKSGIVTALVFFPMAATGYLIQAVTHAGWLQALVVVHLVTGGIYLFGLLAHALVFRKSKRASGVRTGEVTASPPGGRKADGGAPAGNPGPTGAAAPTGRAREAAGAGARGRETRETQATRSVRPPAAGAGR